MAGPERSMRADENIFLVGLMGAGKTSIGRLLAKRLGKAFFDSDQEIERATGVKIPVIFEIEGEAGFRAREARMLAELVQGGNIVLATGGGAVLSAAEPQAPRARTASSSTCAPRSPTSGTARGTTATGRCCSTAEPLAKLEQLYAERDPLYREVADIIVDTGEPEPGQPRAQARAPAACSSSLGRGDAFGQPGARRLTWRVHADPDRRAGEPQLPDPHRAGAARAPRADRRAPAAEDGPRSSPIPPSARSTSRRCGGRWRSAASRWSTITLPDGEQHKDWETLNGIFDALLENRCERGTTLIALGGGVVGDLAGFAAAVYQRGVPFIQVPTTLLAQVDSAVGGKTADQPSRSART